MNMKDAVKELGFDREAMFPNFYADLRAGRALVSPWRAIRAAQNRVAARRFIREAFPPLARDLTNKTDAELARLLDIIFAMKGKDT